MAEPVIEELRQIAGSEQNNISIKALLRLVIAGVAKMSDDTQNISDKLEQTNEKLRSVTDNLQESQKTIDVVKKIVLTSNGSNQIRLLSWGCLLIAIPSVLLLLALR